METRRPRRFLVGSVVAVSLLLGGTPWGVVRAASAQDQTLYMAFTGADGTPVTDMTAEEIIIQWDEMPCEIRELEPLNWPVRVTVFVDNATESQTVLPDMREGLTGFLDALPPDIEVAIATTGGRPQYLTEHTTDRAALADAIGTIASQGGAATFFDALYEEAERIDDDDDRAYLPAIVMVAVAGSEGSGQARGQNLERMMDRLYENAAVVHTLLLPSPLGGVGATQGRPQTRWGTDIAAATRGRFEALTIATQYRTLLPEIGADLARKHALVRHQYRVTYRPPRDASDQPRVQVGTTRTGLLTFPTDNGNIP